MPVAAASASAAPTAEPAPLACPPRMAYLARGTLRIGDRTVEMAETCLDQREVTAQEYKECVERGACDDEELECDGAWTYGKPELADHPINCVSWKQADRYCRSVGKRLPTFEEWEWAAQVGPEGRRFAWGSDEPGADHLCWSFGASRAGTCPVGSFPRSRTPDGIDDLFGNVWEWLSPPSRNGVANVSRGSSWNNDSIDTLEGDNAGGFTSDFVRNDVVGFRCAAGR